jgi:hypothetical protein
LSQRKNNKSTKRPAALTNALKKSQTQSFKTSPFSCSGCYRLLSVPPSASPSVVMSDPVTQAKLLFAGNDVVMLGYGERPINQLLTEDFWLKTL